MRVAFAASSFHAVHRREAPLSGIKVTGIQPDSAKQKQTRNPARENRNRARSGTTLIQQIPPDAEQRPSMKVVVLHVYDVTNSGSEKANNTILQINRLFKDRIGLGGIFHSAVQVYGNEEWSFGFCEFGSGVFSCPPCRNPLYTYRESIILGETNCTNAEVNQILRELRREWPGTSYDLLSRNCNHFCDVFCGRIGVPKLPAWVNRFAHAGDAAMEAAENTAIQLRQAKEEIVSASKSAYRFIAGIASNSPAAQESADNSQQTVSRFQGAWFKNLISSVGAKPSTSTETIRDTESPLAQHRQHRRESSI